MTREPWRSPDPAPDEDLPADIAFGVWLESLDPLVVIRDYEVGLKGIEKSHLAYLRRRIAQTRKTRPATPPDDNQRERT